MSAPSDEAPPQAEEALNSDTDNATAELRELNVSDVVPNEANPRLDFPQDELDRLTGSIDLEGVLVPIVVYPRGDKFVLVDGERRFRCARDLGHSKIPALITTERSEREVLQQMFNIHLIREPWRDIPTAKALQRLAQGIEEAEGRESNDTELRDLTGLSMERVRQLRYVVTLPGEWQDYIREETIPLNFFWELKKNVIDALQKNRPVILAEFGEDRVSAAFVQKRLDQVITDTVSLRKVSPIIKFAAQDAAENGTGESTIDTSIRELIEKPDATIEEAFEDTVQMMVEVDKLGRRTSSMMAVFSRLLTQTAGMPDNDEVKRLGRELIAQLGALLNADERSV
ncbi:ParB/RepB/Spo0J family partition protein [Curtobacterium sp. PhB42]|uniref:ParB/RepB/Spo0J family partition protein n=1 Tax=unclassified Curtobacterium TaxID=257496 RepID=UPI0010E621F5|nr:MULTISPECIES: ParB N-terminal domain-containing protein [unclassified Curtobacterium]TDW39742.1 ParB/RepB/Spo0J family partition protein [Curtobacterium sp. PhB42]TDW50913.1 ParB/RepB/Spo0J family partition protein [Curtobacterium sp. PhB190]